MRALRALAAALMLLVLVAGIPVGLWLVGQSLLPTALPTWDQIVLLLRNPLSGDFLVVLLIVVGWIAWATFAVAVIAEAAALLRGRRPPRLPALGAQQRLAAVLLAAVIVGIASGPTTAQAATPPAPLAGLGTGVVSTQVAPTDAPMDVTGPQGRDAAESDPALILQVYTVQPGDTLWDIAETQLGDGHRWKEIADLNYGEPQPDGGTLSQAHWIEAGWQLQLPLEAESVPGNEATTQPEQITVEPGDTLYDLAEEHLGDGDLYPQIFDASQELEQPGGAHLTDPAVIYPGWQLTIPRDQTAGDDTQPAAEPETPTEREEPVEDPPTLDDDGSGLPVAERGAESEQVPSSSSTGQAEDSSESGTDVDDIDETQAWSPATLRTAGGVGALLAAGVVALIAARRRQIGRSCPPGARVALPEADSAPAQFEQELRTVADPIGREQINLALRDLAAQADAANTPRPAVMFVRYAGDGSEMQLYLAEPADLPHPWLGSQDRRVWSITDEELTEHIAARTSILDVPAAYPALVGLGLGDQKTHLLADLERLEHLDLRGDPDTAYGVFAALLLELASSHWADDLQVTVVGRHTELVQALASPRVLYLPTAQQALDRLDTLAPEPHGSRQWPPEVVFFAVDLTQDEGERLRELMQEAPSAAVVTVGADLGQAAIEARAGTIDATLAPSGMPIQVQHLSPEEYAEIVEVLGASYVPGPAWTSNLADAREPVIADLPDPDPTERLESLIEPESLFEVEHTVPQVRVLGPVELVGADTAVLSGTVGHLHAAVEMTAYLAMNDGATTEQFAAALWPNQSIKPATRHSAVSRTRRLLGINTEGAWRLSTVTDGAGGPIKRYHLAEVGSDWEDFNRLRGPDPSSTPLPDLRRALMLVRGVPFSQVRDGVGRVRANRYLWSDALAVEMTASIIDVACEAARRALVEGKPRLAAEAADAGLRASTDHERVWRYAIRARVLMGEHAAATELMEALTQRLTELDIDPERETNLLLDQASAAIDQAAS